MLAGRILISEINSNHDSRTPQALARNVVLIRELNSNLNKVRSVKGPPSLAACICLATVQPTTLRMQVLEQYKSLQADLPAAQS